MCFCLILLEFYFGTMIHVTIRLNKSADYLDDSSDVHLGDHLSGVEEHEQRVQRERHILQRRVMLKCFGGVHAHRDDADDGTGPQQGVHPLQRKKEQQIVL